MTDPSESSYLNLVFRWIGFFCAVSFLLSVVFLIQDAGDGRFDQLAAFFDRHTGIQPFIIFTGPVIFIGGPAWLYRFFLKRWIRRPKG